MRRDTHAFFLVALLWSCGDGRSRDGGPDGSTGSTGGIVSADATGPAATSSMLDSSSSGGAQIECGCPPLVHEGSLEASSNADLEPLRGVTRVTEDLMVTGAVTSLEALECLCSVTGDFRIEGTQLSDLSGLGSLVRVYDLDLIGNSSLLSLDGLGVVEVENVVRLWGNPTIETARFEALQSGVTVSIGNCDTASGNATLSRLEFPSIVAGAGITVLSVASNPELSELSGVLEVSSSITVLQLENNGMLDGPATADAWIAAGHDPDRVETCGNLGDAEPCMCPIK